MRRLNLLFVADDMEVVTPARAALARDFAVKLLEVDTAKDFALSLRFGAFDAVLCDNRMARFSSMEALERWKAAGAPMPFMLITGRVGRELAGASIVASGGGYLVKGHVAGLPTAMREVLDEHAAARARRGRETESARSRAEPPLSEPQSPTDQSLGVFSHELRTPLNTILGHADLLLESIGREVDDEGKRSLAAIIRGATRLTHLINDMLDLARLHIGALRPQSYRFDATRLVAEVTETFVPVAAAKGLTLSCLLPAEAVAVQTDAHRLRQVLGYLIDNAIKFTPQGEIRVHLSSREDAIIIEVRDTGIGISAIDQLHVFDDFRQVDASSTRSYGGCGLGLAVSRRLVALLGGTIDVESQVGLGSCFRVCLPRDLSGRADDRGRQSTTALRRE